MTAALVEKAPAKINLSLRIVGRRADGYHELESLVAFADKSDALTLTPCPAPALEVSGRYAAASGPLEDNLVLKAVRVLGEQVPGLKAGHFHLDKNLPPGGGIGGGSSDAAAALRLLARLNGIAIDDPRLASAARAVGADVPVCLDPRPRIMRGVGELLSAPIDLPAMPAVLVNPGVPVATREVFSKLAPQNGKTSLGDVPKGYDAVIAYLDKQGNDLTLPAIACAPIIEDVLTALRAWPGVRLARMSGSGSTCFALFRDADEAATAARCLQAERADWWVQATTIGKAASA
ncbi:MAG TPA: 4-(cytidine 5'-diphospho)-2-C-methyl-D-erythritol kinase [Pseudolabrys sp.]|nr:4-(cytidine 5'-diphospho)-2-C-methyl-D-erythritol kinase [Pseudolabrys sp.]